MSDRYERLYTWVPELEGIYNEFKFLWLQSYVIHSLTMCFLELLRRREGVMVQGVERDCAWAGCCCLQQQRNPQSSGDLSWPQGRSCVICGCWGAETSLPTSSRCCCPTSSIQSAAAGTESWPGQAGSPLPSLALCAHLAVPVGGMDQHWLIPGTARSALSVQLKMSSGFDLVCTLPRAGLWLPLLN